MAQDFSQLDKPIQFLKGVGPKRSEAFGRMGIVTARDLLYHVPRRYDDASTIQPVSSLDVGMDATAVGRVRSKGIVPTRSGLRIFQAVLQDESGMITCAWPGQPWLDRKDPEGGPPPRHGPGEVLPRSAAPAPGVHPPGEGRGGGRRRAPRDHLRVLSCQRRGPPVGPPAGLFEEPGLASRAGRGRRVPGRPESGTDLGLIPLGRALDVLHRPTTLARWRRAAGGLAFDELFFLQLVQAQVRFQQTEAQPGIAFRAHQRAHQTPP